MSEMCVCGNAEGTNKECERCELLRMGGVLSRLAMRLADRLEELGEEVMITAEEAGALVRRTEEETERVLREMVWILFSDNAWHNPVEEKQHGETETGTARKSG